MLSVLQLSAPVGPEIKKPIPRNGRRGVRAGMAAVGSAGNTSAADSCVRRRECWSVGVSAASAADPAETLDRAAVAAFGARPVDRELVVVLHLDRAHAPATVIAALARQRQGGRFLARLLAILQGAGAVELRPLGRDLTRRLLLCGGARAARLVCVTSGANLTASGNTALPGRADLAAGGSPRVLRTLPRQPPTVCGRGRCRAPSGRRGEGWQRCAAS